MNMEITKVKLIKLINEELSTADKSVIKKMLNGQEISYENSGLSKREWNELMQSFDQKDKIV